MSDQDATAKKGRETKIDLTGIASQEIPTLGKDDINEQ